MVEPTLRVLTETGALERTVLASFDQDIIDAVREQAPGTPLAMTEAGIRTFYVLSLVGLHPWWRAPGEVFQVPEHSGGIHVLTPRFVRAAEHLGLEVEVWTVNETADLERVVQAGAHGVMTDFPDRLADVLGEGGAAAAEAELAPIRSAQDTLGSGTGWRVVTVLGDVEFYLVFMPLVLWCLSWRVGVRLGVMLLLTSGLNSVLKLASGSARPFFLDPGAGRVSEASFGIPSGHAQNAVAIWGLLAAALRRWWAWVAAAVLIALISVSRIALGAHFWVDLVVGWGAGLVLLGAVLALAGPVERRLARAPAADQVLTAVAASLSLVALGVLTSSQVRGMQAPFTWVDGVDLGEVTAASGAVRSAGALLGVGLGLVLLRSRGGFDVTGRVLHKVLRYAVGIAGVGVLYVGLGPLLPGGHDLLGELARFVRYSLIGLWVTGVAPLLFVRLGWAGHAAAGSAARR